jgi:hypothetical protein
MKCWVARENPNSPPISSNSSRWLRSLASVAEAIALWAVAASPRRAAARASPWRRPTCAEEFFARLQVTEVVSRDGHETLQGAEKEVQLGLTRGQSWRSKAT